MTTDAWLAFNFDRLEPSMRWMDVVGRLKPGVSLKQAQAELSTITPQTLQKQTSEGAAGFVLLIACANVANLFLARGATRRKEMSIRGSLGASRRRLVSQALTESVVLALLGGTLGLFVAIWGQKIVLLLNPVEVSLSLALDGRAFGFTLVMSLLTALLFGIVPALQSSKANVNELLKEAGSRTGGGQRQRGRAMLLISEIAFSLILLVGAGLLINSLLRLQRVGLGFNPKNLLTADVVLNGPKYWHNLPDIKKRVTPQGALFFQQVLERIEALPGVTAAGVAHLAPPRYVQMRSFRTLGQIIAPEQTTSGAYLAPVACRSHFKTSLVSPKTVSSTRVATRRILELPSWPHFSFPK